MVDLSTNHIFNILTTNLNNFLPRLPNAIVTLLAGYLVIRLLSWIGWWLLSFIRMPRGLRQIVIGVVDTLLTFFLIIIFLNSLGLGNVALVLSAMVAAAGIALGNSSVTLLGDVLGGIQLAKDRDFSLGDEVQVFKDPGDVFMQGVVEGMDMRRCRIRDQKGNLHIFPNSYIDKTGWVLVAKKKDRAG